MASRYAVEHFLLPADVRGAIQAELDQQLMAQIAEDKTRREAIKNAPRTADSSLTDELLGWHEKYLSDESIAHSRRDPVYRVFQREEVETQFASGQLNLRSVEERDVKRLRAICVDLAKRGEYRRIGLLQADWTKHVRDMMSRFPNFARVLTYLCAMFVFQSKNAPSPFPIAMPRLPPILLDGPPGIGKSTFVQALAECFTLPFYRFDLGSMQTGGALTGSDEMWSNSKSGKVFQTFAECEYANPFFMLDELDKMSPTERFEPESALLTLLEPATAKTFHDMSVPTLSLDVSYATWIGTCNDRRAISAPILSRFRIFTIPSIGADQVEVFTLRMLDEVAKELGVTGVQYTLQQAAVNLLAKLPPRAMRRTMRECIAYACMQGKRTISAKLVEQAVEDPAVFREGVKRIGF